MKRLVTDEYLSEASEMPLHHPGQPQSSADSADPEAQQRDRLEQDAGSDDDTDDEGGETDDDIQSLDALEEQFHLLEEEVATLVADVHDLALYTKLNITGFMKILKVRSSRPSRGPTPYSRCSASRNTTYDPFLTVI